MRTLFTILFVLGFAFTTGSSALGQCTTIQDGMLVDSAGISITTGYDEWGYNY